MAAQRAGGGGRWVLQLLRGGCWPRAACRPAWTLLLLMMMMLPLLLLLELGAGIEARWVLPRVLGGGGSWSSAGCLLYDAFHIYCTVESIILCILWISLTSSSRGPIPSRSSRGARHCRSCLPTASSGIGSVPLVHGLNWRLDGLPASSRLLKRRLDRLQSWALLLLRRREGCGRRLPPGLCRLHLLRQGAEGQQLEGIFCVCRECQGRCCESVWASKPARCAAAA
jgi:hypothetical protein